MNDVDPSRPGASIIEDQGANQHTGDPGKRSSRRIAIWRRRTPDSHSRL
jgi:hypothetical protein